MSRWPRVLGGRQSPQAFGSVGPGLRRRSAFAPGSLALLDGACSYAGIRTATSRPSRAPRHLPTHAGICSAPPMCPPYRVGNRRHLEIDRLSYRHRYLSRTAVDTQHQLSSVCDPAALPCSCPLAPAPPPPPPRPAPLAKLDIYMSAEPVERAWQGVRRLFGH